MNTPLENNPIRHIQKIKAQMSRIINHLRDDLGTVTEAKAEALFATSAEVLADLIQAYDDYEHEHQKVWRSKLSASLMKSGPVPASRR